MFEGYAADLLATSLGRFVDVQKDKLRISLWSGSGVLENVRLRSEAFEYLKLPFAIHEGVIPWGNWLYGSLVVELSDVLLAATERADSEWEEPAALRREEAAKQADLAAAELAKLSRRMAINVRNVHIAFRGRQDGVPFAAGVALESVSTVAEPKPPKSVLARLYGAALGRHSQGQQHNPTLAPTASVTMVNGGASASAAAAAGGAHAYSSYAHALSAGAAAQAPDGSNSTGAGAGSRQGSTGSGRPLTPPPSHQASAAAAIAGVAAGAGAAPSAPSLTFATGGGTHVEVVAGCEAVAVQVRPEQLQSMIQLLDDMAVWVKRGRYGRFRPPGCSSDPGRLAAMSRAALASVQETVPEEDEGSLAPRPQPRATLSSPRARVLGTVRQHSLPSHSADADDGDTRPASASDEAAVLSDAELAELYRLLQGTSLQAAVAAGRRRQPQHGGGSWPSLGALLSCATGAPLHAAGAGGGGGGMAGGMHGSVPVRRELMPEAGGSSSCSASDDDDDEESWEASGSGAAASSPGHRRHHQHRHGHRHAVQEPGPRSTSRLEVHVRPLRMLHRPKCFAALGTALAIDMSASLEHHAMHAVAAFASRDARVLSKLQRTGCVVPGAQHISLRALPPPTRAGSSVWSRRGSLSQMGELEAGAGAGARQSQPPQPQAAAVEVSLLPSGLHLRGTLSRSRLEQDTSAPSLAVRLALGGLTNSRLHASKIAEVQRLFAAMAAPAAADGAASSAAAAEVGTAKAAADASKVSQSTQSTGPDEQPPAGTAIATASSSVDADVSALSAPPTPGPTSSGFSFGFGMRRPKRRHEAMPRCARTPAALRGRFDRDAAEVSASASASAVDLVEAGSEQAAPPGAAAPPPPSQQHSQPLDGAVSQTAVGGAAAATTDTAFAARPRSSQEMLRLPLIERTVALQMLIEPFDITYALDGAASDADSSTDASSNNNSSSTCAGQGASPALIRLSTGGRCDVLYSQCGAASSLSLQLRRLQLRITPPAPAPNAAPTAPAAAPASGVLGTLLATPTSIWLSSLTADVSRTMGGGLSTCGAVSGLRLLGAPDQPGRFLLSNGARADDAALRNCAVLAVAPSRTPFAAASGSGHVACQALLSLDRVQFRMPPAPLPAHSPATQPAGSPFGVAGRHAQAAVGGPAGTAAPAASTGGPADARSRRQRSSSGANGACELPELTASYRPVPAPGARSPQLVATDAGYAAPATQPAQAAHAAASSAAGQALPPLAMALTAVMSRLEVSLQPQQAGVLCAMLAELAPQPTAPAAPTSSAEQTTVQPRRQPAPPSAATPAQPQPRSQPPPQEPPPHGVTPTPWGLPRLAVSLSVDCATALLGSDALSEEASVLYCRGVRLSYDCTGEDGEAEACLGWREVTLASVASRLDPLLLLPSPAPTGRAGVGSSASLSVVLGASVEAAANGCLDRLTLALPEASLQHASLYAARRSLLAITGLLYDTQEHWEALGSRRLPPPSLPLMPPAFPEAAPASQRALLHAPTMPLPARGSAAGSAAALYEHGVEHTVPHGSLVVVESVSLAERQFAGRHVSNRLPPTVVPGAWAPWPPPHQHQHQHQQHTHHAGFEDVRQEAASHSEYPPTHYYGPGPGTGPGSSYPAFGRRRGSRGSYASGSGSGLGAGTGTGAGSGLASCTDSEHSLDGPNGGGQHANQQQHQHQQPQGTAGQHPSHSHSHPHHKTALFFRLNGGPALFGPVPFAAAAGSRWYFPLPPLPPPGAAAGAVAAAGTDLAAALPGHHTHGPSHLQPSGQHQQQHQQHRQVPPLPLPAPELRVVCEARPHALCSRRLELRSNVRLRNSSGLWLALGDWALLEGLGAPAGSRLGYGRAASMPAHSMHIAAGASKGGSGSQQPAYGLQESPASVAGAGSAAGRPESSSSVLLHTLPPGGTVWLSAAVLQRSPVVLARPEWELAIMSPLVLQNDLPLSVPVWVYNCLGLPVQLRPTVRLVLGPPQRDGSDAAGASGAAWVPPGLLAALGPGGGALRAAGAGASAAPAAADGTSGGYAGGAVLLPSPLAPRCVALHLLPRYVVHNGLTAAVQLRQQGTSPAASLGLGERRPVAWADVGLPLRVQLRIQDPGWSWSGGVALEELGPGDLFVKIRHRNRAETQLVRLDVSLSSAGTLVVGLSHHHTDFAPYRIDNCSSEVLHVQQVGCLDAEDVVRPYSCLPYTWDEHTPGRQQRVLLSLPGRRRLGEVELDKVGTRLDVAVVPSQTGGHGRKRLLRISVTADGPTRVLRVVDTGAHPSDALPATAHQHRHHGFHGSLLVGPAKVAAAASLAHVRWDNCLRGAAFPIMVYGPNASVAAAPLAVSIEETHLRELIGLASRMAAAATAPLEDLSAVSGGGGDDAGVAVGGWAPGGEATADGFTSGVVLSAAPAAAVSWRGAWVTLRPLDMRYALMRDEALGQNIFRHYMSCAVLELIKVVGSLDIFGDVVRLLQALGVGMWHLVSMPVAGALRGDMVHFAAGLAGGVLSMARNVTYAASNSAVKASRRARSTLSALIPEPIHTQPYSPDAVSAAAGGGFTGSSGGNRAGLAGRAGAARGVRGGESTWEGYAAILQRVATQASRLSLLGTARELLLGGLGAVALPTVAVLQLVEVAAASVRSARYCWLEALCRLLQAELRGGAFAEEPYVGGVQLTESTFAVVLYEADAVRLVALLEEAKVASNLSH
eukprot:XP_001697171.1 predicted protein [Chlamydomonas reinhardtii]